MYVDLLFSLWCSSCGVVCLMNHWSLSVTYVNPVLMTCRMDVSMSNFYPCNGMRMSFCVWMTCGVVDVVCHNGIDGCSSCMWNWSGVTCIGVVVIIPMS